MANPVARPSAQLPLVDVVGVGLNATDTLVSLPAYPERGAKLEYSDLRVLPGGQVATTIVACQTWGLSTRYVGKLGDDDAARLHRTAFEQAGVDARLITIPGGISPQSLIMVDSGGERTVLCRRDEQMTLQPGEMERDWVVNARILHVDGHDTAAALQATRWAREAGVLTVADLDEVYPRVEELITNIDYLIVNEDFSCRLMDEKSPGRALRAMQARYSSRLAAATMGRDGVLAWDGRKLTHRASFDVSIVDTTGAGDIFRAGFIYGLLKGWPLERQLDFSCAAAALNCTGQGARGGIKPVASIQELVTKGTRCASEYRIAD